MEMVGKSSLTCYELMIKAIDWAFILVYLISCMSYKYTYVIHSDMLFVFLLHKDYEVGHSPRPYY